MSLPLGSRIEYFCLSVFPVSQSETSPDVRPGGFSLEHIRPPLPRQRTLQEPFLIHLAHLRNIS